MTRYVVDELPFAAITTPGATHCYAVVDTRPEAELYENFIGKMIMETIRPARRQIAYCPKKQHAEALAAAMNDLAGETVDALRAAS